MWIKTGLFSLPHIITVLNTISEAFDESGDLISQDYEKFDLPAFVDENNGREFWAAGGYGLAHNERAAMIYCNYDERITARTKILFEGRIFEINWINDANNAHYFLNISAIEVNKNVNIS